MAGIYFGKLIFFFSLKNNKITNAIKTKIPSDRIKVAKLTNANDMYVFFIEYFRK